MPMIAALVVLATRFDTARGAALIDALAERGRGEHRGPDR